MNKSDLEQEFLSTEKTHPTDTPSDANHPLESLQSRPTESELTTGSSTARVTPRTNTQTTISQSTKNHKKDQNSPSKAPQSTSKDTRLLKDPQNRQQESHNLEDSQPSTPPYNPFQIPPDLSLAQLHWQSSMLGRIPKRSQQICPYCNEPKKIKYSLMENPVNLTENGNTIPLYFQYTRYCLLATFMIFIAYAGVLFDLRGVYCEYYFIDEGKRASQCPFYLLPSYFWYSGEFYSKNFEKIKTAYFDNIYFVFFMNVLLYLSTFVYKYNQYWLIEKHKELNLNSASNFTIMLERVYATDKRDDFEMFLQGLLNQSDVSKKKLNVVKTTVATYKGNLRRFSNQSTSLLMEVKALEEQLRGLEKAKNKPQNQADLEIYAQKKEIIQKMIRKRRRLRARILRQKTSWMLPPMAPAYPNENCIAFVTLPSNYDRDRVLYAYSKRYSKFWCLEYIDFCFSRGPRYRLSCPPEPENIEWRFIGYSALRKNLSGSLALFLNFLLVPICAVILMLFGYLFFRASKRVSDLLYVAVDGMRILFIQVVSQCSKMLFKRLSKMEKPLTTVRYMTKKAVSLGFLKFFVIMLAAMSSSLANESKIFMFKVQNELFLRNILIFVFFQSLIEPLMDVFNVKLIRGYLRRRSIERIKKTKERIKATMMTQNMLNELYSRPDSQLDMKYSGNFYSLIVVSVVTPALPAIGVVIFTVLILKSLLERYLFYRVFKAPPKTTDKLADRLYYASFTQVRFFSFISAAVFIFKYARDGKYFIDFLLLLLALFLALSPMAYMTKWLIESLIEKKLAIKEDKLYRNYADVYPYLKTDYDIENPRVASAGGLFGADSILESEYSRA